MMIGRTVLERELVNWLMQLVFDVRLPIGLKNIAQKSIEMSVKASVENTATASHHSCEMLFFPLLHFSVHHLPADSGCAVYQGAPVQMHR
jgi:hypothetical protein